MTRLINIYCDETCHLESSSINQDNRFMVLGGIACSESNKQEIFRRIKDIKAENGLTQLSEMKWTKISSPKLPAYRDLINYFFDCNELSFRCVVIDKEQLQHTEYNQTHDEFYYKMYWQMLEWFIEPANHHYNIYLDIKDTQGVEKVRSLHEVLCSSTHDYNREIISRIQEVRSHEIAILQLVDIIIGAISYTNRYGDNGKSTAKKDIVSLIQKRSNLSLCKSTSLGARKFNIFHWESRR